MSRMILGPENVVHEVYLAQRFY